MTAGGTSASTASCARKPRYTVEVSRSDGQHRPRILEVTGGAVFQVSDDGQRSRLRQNELHFRMPVDGEAVEGWIPKPEEARAPTPARGT